MTPSRKKTSVCRRRDLRLRVRRVGRVLEMWYKKRRLITHEDRLDLGRTSLNFELRRVSIFVVLLS